MLKKYRPGFEVWAAALTALVMLPNIIWFALPGHPFDFLSVQSVPPAADAIASTARVLMIACLCFLKNRQAPPLRLSPLTSACAACVLAYCLIWALYLLSRCFMWSLYIRAGASAPLIWGLCLFPCAAFTLFSADRRNYPALAFALIFTVCHAVCTQASLLAV